MFWTIAFPVFFILLFGVIFSGGGDSSYRVGVADEDRTRIGSALAQAFGKVEILGVIEGSPDDLLEKLKRGELNEIVVIPEGVSAAVMLGKTADIRVHYNPSNQVTAQVLLTVVDKVLGGVGQGLAGRTALFAVRMETITASSLRTIDFLVPGILATAIMRLGIFATTPPLAQLREQQVLRRLGATPFTRTMLLAAQVAPRITIGLAQTGLIILVGILVFQVRIVGNLLYLAGFVVLGALSFVCLGYFMSTWGKTQEGINGASQFINFPMMFLSGLFFPVDSMPRWILPVVDAMPLSYLTDGFRQIMVGGTPLHPLGTDLLVLMAWLVICAVLAVKFFR
ncbi:MAG: ABC transporter permease [Anaerolineales bacterium]|nr:ABC transporter permease [Anaerolineales bacterium]